MKDYAQVLSTCCNAILHRPYTGKDSGDFFCKECGEVYNVQTFEGTSFVTKTDEHGVAWPVDCTCGGVIGDPCPICNPSPLTVMRISGTQSVNLSQDYKGWTIK